MRKIFLLKGQNPQSAIDFIRTNIGLDPWFVLNNPHIALHEYLTGLHEDFGLENTVLSRLKICRNLVFKKRSVCFQQPLSGHDYPEDMVDLLKLLRVSGRPQIIIENNNKTLLADIAQQLLYLNYPLNRLYLRLRYETGGENALADLARDCVLNASRAQAALDMLPTLPEARKLRQQLDICRSVLGGNATGLLELSLAASKKSGKSTLLNCLLGLDLAPNSSELATPNACAYSPSKGANFYLHIGDQKHEFNSANDLKNRIEEEYKKAQRDGDSGFALPDMHVEYPDCGTLPDNWRLVDTPGPDAAGASHRQSAEKALSRADAALFLIDYSKYLTENEYAYLSWIRKVFSGRGHSHMAFVLNKMDLALQDSGAKSWVKSIDFIRSRLADLDSHYTESLIFPVSALNYANLLRLRKNAARHSALKRLLEDSSRWDREAERQTRTLELDEESEESLERLFGETRRMGHMLGLKNPTTSQIMELSGVPQLRDYIFYRIGENTRWSKHARSLAICQEHAKTICSIIDAADSGSQAKLRDICAPFLQSIAMAAARPNQPM